MKIGKLDPKNEEFINDYKAMGYQTTADLVNDAVRALRQQTTCRLRKDWPAAAFAEISETGTGATPSDIGNDLAPKAIPIRRRRSHV